MLLAKLCLSVHMNLLRLYLSVSTLCLSNNLSLSLCSLWNDLKGSVHLIYFWERGQETVSRSEIQFTLTNGRPKRSNSNCNDAIGPIGDTIKSTVAASVRNF